MNDYYQVKDKCREGLIRHLTRVCLTIPRNPHSDILDAGCGTGVPTIWMAQQFPGKIIAIDIDQGALEHLRTKITNNNLQHKIETRLISFSDFTSQPDVFDMVVAEGFLNVIGFDFGFRIINEMLKKGGTFIIHDEYRDHAKKCGYFKKYRYAILQTLYLDENVWWQDYYQQLEMMIHENRDLAGQHNVESDLNEIETYKTNPSAFRSIYYLLKKE